MIGYQIAPMSKAYTIFLTLPKRSSSSISPKKCHQVHYNFCPKIPGFHASIIRSIISSCKFYQNRLTIKTSTAKVKTAEAARKAEECTHPRLVSSHFLSSPSNPCLKTSMLTPEKRPHPTYIHSSPPTSPEIGSLFQTVHL